MDNGLMAGGRPTKKTPERIAKCLELAQKGKTNVQMAEIIGVAESTIRYWKEMDFEFSTAVKELKQEADQLVEASLFKKANGFERVLQQQAHHEGEIVKFETRVYIPPSDTSMIFWLKNRDPNRWKDRKEEEIKVLILKKELLGELTEQELIAYTEQELLKIKEASPVQNKTLKSK